MEPSRRRQGNMVCLMSYGAVGAESGPDCMSASVLCYLRQSHIHEGESYNERVFPLRIVIIYTVLYSNI